MRIPDWVFGNITLLLDKLVDIWFSPHFDFNSRGRTKATTDHTIDKKGERACYQIKKDKN